MFNFAQALFLITVHWNVSVTCLQHLQELLKIFELCAFSMSGSCKRFSTRTSSDQNLDFCTLLTVLDDRRVNVCCFCNCSAWVSCRSSNFEARLALRIVHCMSLSLVCDSFMCCHFSFCSFSLVLMLSRLEISQFSPHILQFTFQHQRSHRLCIP